MSEREKLDTKLEENGQSTPVSVDNVSIYKKKLSELEKLKNFYLVIMNLNR